MWHLQEYSSSFLSLNPQKKTLIWKIYLLYLRCGGVGVSQLRVCHGSNQIKEAKAGVQTRGDIQQHPCQKQIFTSDTSSEQVSKSAVQFLKSEYLLPPYPNDGTQTFTHHFHFTHGFKSNFLDTVAVPPPSASTASWCILQSKASL